MARSAGVVGFIRGANPPVPLGHPPLTGGEFIIHQQRIPAFDGVQRAQNRLAGHIKAVAAHPLNFPDPDRHPGQLGGVGVNLNPFDAFRPNRRKLPVQPQRLGVQIDAMFQVLERQQRQIQEIAGPTGRIENPRLPQPFQKAVAQVLSRLARPGRGRRTFGGVSLGEVRGDFTLDALPLRAQGPDDHRFHQQPDFVAVGVMRAQLAALVRVKTALEQRAEDGGVNLAPVQPGRLQHPLDGGLIERQCRLAIEQPAIEPRDRLETDAAPRLHRPEQIPRHVRELGGSARGVLQQAGEQLVRQQADVFCEQAEHQPVDEVSRRLGIVALGTQHLRQPGKLFSGFLGQGLAGLARLQTFRVGERPLEPLAFGRIVQIIQRQLVNLLDGVGPVGMDTKPLQIAHHQQRRILQRDGVLLQLKIGGFQVLALALVLPAETAALPHIGPAFPAAQLGRAFLEAIALAPGISLGGRRLAQQPAQINKVLLRRRPFLEFGVAPLADKVLWGHGLGTLEAVQKTNIIKSMAYVCERPWPRWLTLISRPRPLPQSTS